MAALVFVLWYPMPYREASGGRELFTIVIAVDVILGPLITLAIYDNRKPWRELRRDLAIVVAIQLAGLAYGLWSVERARPAFVALEFDRLRVVRSIELSDDDLAQAPPGLNRRSWAGPIEVAARQPRPEEKIEALEKALGGLDIGARPSFWRPPAETTAAWASGGRPVARLRQMHPGRGGVIDAAVAATGRPEATLKYLPIIARRADFVVLIDGATGTVVGHAELDGH